MDLKDLLKDRRVVIAAGVAAALSLGLIIALSSIAKNPKSDAPPPASQGGLVVEMGRDDDTKIDPTRELRCFVGGQFVGMSSLADCAKRNGVATGALDVGIDVTGGLAATGEAGTLLTPLPPTEEQAALAPQVATVPAATPSPAPASRAPLAACWRYADGAWSRLADMSLNACVQTLFAGKCERPGSATYGRWGERTMRLVPGKVEQGPDYHTLVEQGTNCAIPPL